MKIKTSELTGAALDWAVAKCEGDKVFRPRVARPDDWDKAAWLENGSDDRYVVRVQHENYARFVDWTYNPSTNWMIGGPIIEREEIAVGKGWKQWAAFKDADTEDGVVGPTPLIAAMRCYVASQLGDEVDVPDELSNNREGETA
jgi:hypothetical protein